MENFKMAFASLGSSKLRTGLTMLGIIIGISAVVAINAIGDGVKKQITDQIAGLGSNVITVTSGQVVSSKPGQHSTPNPAASFGSSTLSQTDVTAIQSVQHISRVAPIMLISGIAARGDRTADGALLIATTPALNQIRNTKLERGRFLNPADATQNFVVLGSQAKQDLFGSTNPLEQTMSIRGTSFKVIGVLTSTDNGASIGGPSFDSAIYLPLDSAKALAGGNVQILRILAQADASANVAPAVSSIKSALLKTHGGQEDFSVLTQADLVATISTILDLLSTFITAIASIALIVGGIGIMNIMLVSVTERTHEIGLRKALGATKGNILTQFLIEAVTLSLLGGLIGAIVATFLAGAAGHLTKITPVFTVDTYATAASVSVVIGVIFGIAPAIKAARKRPIEALRHE